MEIKDVSQLPELGAWLKEKREAKGISGYKLDREHSVFFNTSIAIEKGEEKGYTFQTLLRYCAAIGVKVTFEEESDNQTTVSEAIGHGDGRFQ